MDWSKCFETYEVKTFEEGYDYLLFPLYVPYRGSTVVPLERVGEYPVSPFRIGVRLASEPPYGTLRRTLLPSVRRNTPRGHSAKE